MKRGAVGWIGMCLSLSGVAIQSLLPEFTRYSFLVFLTSSTVWLTHGLLKRDRPLICTQAVLLTLNAIAAVRWLT